MNASMPSPLWLDTSHVLVSRYKRNFEDPKIISLVLTWSSFVIMKT